MSGIVGVFRRHGGPASETDIRRMLASLEPRGPDRSGIWCDGPVGLGNCMLCTTEESRLETLPAKHPIAPVVIAADGRIDNRRELRESLGIRAAEAPTDSDLMLAA